jgi:hypothetical protein
MTLGGRTLIGITALLVIAAVLVGNAEFIRALMGNWSFTKSVEQDRSVYYRLKVNLTYNGEPQDFDIVVGCNVRQISYLDGGRTVEVGLVPTVFGRRMSDGKGLVVRPPRACRGETTDNGEVQPDLLPVVLVYDDADILDLGLAYLSEDAYESPLSVVKFGGARIERASRDEFEQFRRTQTNLVTPEAYHSALMSDADLGKINITRVARPFGHSCQAYQRFHIPEELRSLVAQQWPASHPRYWAPDTFEAEQTITDAISRSKQIDSGRTSDPARPLSAWWIPWTSADFGLPTRGGGGLVTTKRGSLFPPAYYPSSDDRRTDRWPANIDQRPEYLAALAQFAFFAVEHRGGLMRGFAYCFAHVPIANAQWQLLRGKIVNRVDGEQVVSKRPSSGAWIFDRDEYVFRLFQMGLESTRGDV